MSDEHLNTRARIQQVAIELFTERGYDATSLREIAERLGVTKAALYYHFKSKDEIIRSLVEDQATMIEELIAWGREQPRTVQTRRELVRRYASNLYGRFNLMKIMRFYERNQSSIQHHEGGMRVRDLMMSLGDLLRDAEDPLPTQIRRSMALLALHSAWLTLRTADVSDAERNDAALAVALELVE
jgi:AcrR family transcriptional regulator